jgi:DNA modification methylase
MLLQANALRIPLRDNSVHCVVTSPPYWGLRDYGVPGQLGLEPTPEEYVADMVAVFREVKRVLRNDGVLWLNLGDTYMSQPSWGRGDQTSTLEGRKHSEVPHALKDQLGRHSRGTQIGIKPKDLVGIPWRVAFALQADGWYLRSDIIWSKPNPMPESVTDRPTKAHEYIFLLSKSVKYFYDSAAIKEPVSISTIGRGPVDFGGSKGRNYSPVKGDPNFRNGSEQWGRTFDYLKSCNNGRNKRSVWEVSTEPYAEAHFATYPTRLIEPCILAGCPVGGVVLDPFLGSGTTGLVALRLNREFIGIELNPEYCTLAENRIAEEAMQEKLALGI